jgi:hypothetical protein
MAIASSSDSASADVITESFFITSTIHVSPPDVLYFAFHEGILPLQRSQMDYPRRARPTREARH